MNQEQLLVIIKRQIEICESLEKLRANAIQVLSAITESYKKIATTKTTKGNEEGIKNEQKQSGKTN